MNVTANISAELDAIGGIVARASSELEAGAIVELNPLEGRVDALCRRIETLPANEGRVFQARLLALVDDLGRLGQLIDGKLADLKVEMQAATGRQMAANAYAKKSDS